MHYSVAADTDVGTTKKINQDSVLVQHGSYKNVEIVMAIVCDGLGGLDSGELASTTVVEYFKKWFREELVKEIELGDIQHIGNEWVTIIKSLNTKIMDYSRSRGTTMGTTFTGLLLIGDQYMITHVGDTRVYFIGKEVEQLTTDQTFVAQEIRRGAMTVEEAKVHKKKNMLLQCVGASEGVEPELLSGHVKEGMYLLCSDGFRHEISEDEICKLTKMRNDRKQENMTRSIRSLINLAKKRGERDNISAILINIFKEE